VQDTPQLRAALQRRIAIAQLYEGLSAPQLAYATTRAQLVNVRCTRRAGKSRTVNRRNVRLALEVPNARIIYTNTTREECRAIAWIGVNGDGILPLVTSMGLSVKADQTRLEATFANGSTIQLIGADDVTAFDRLRGRALHRVVIDEAQKMPHLRQAIERVFLPAIKDFRGSIEMVGTPGKDCTGLFYETSTGRNPQWEQHQWSVVDNPFFGATRDERYQRTVVEYMRETGKTLDDPDVRREWLGEWVQEDARYVYAVHAVQPTALTFAPARYNSLGDIDLDAAMADLPRHSSGRAHEWFTVLGADLGYDPDPFAWHAWAWTRALPGLWEIGSWSRTKLIPDQQVAILRSVHERLKCVEIVADAGGIAKGLVAGWAQGWQDRDPLPVGEAKKSQKLTNIELLNNDIRTGKVHVRDGGAWLSEARDHVWLTNGTGRYVEHPQTQNHCLDAALYAWRAARHYTIDAIAERPQVGTQAYYDAEEAALERAQFERSRLEAEWD
jgi:hypothetical protein